MVMTTLDTDAADVPVHLYSPSGEMVTKQVPIVDKMEVLGTMLHRDGNSETPLDHRLIKGDRSVFANHDVLFTKDVWIGHRFRESVKRVFLVVTHGCGSWSWTRTVGKRDLCDNGFIFTAKGDQKVLEVVGFENFQNKACFSCSAAQTPSVDPFAGAKDSDRRKQNTEGFYDRVMDNTRTRKGNYEKGKSKGKGNNSKG